MTKIGNACPRAAIIVLTDATTRQTINHIEIETSHRFFDQFAAGC